MTAFGESYDSPNLDVERFADVASKQETNYTIYVYSRTIHGYAGFFFAPEAKYAIRQVDGRLVENIIGKR